MSQDITYIGREDIKENLISILNNEIPKVCAIKGKWGTGKTYLVKEILNDEQFKETSVYISLFNKCSIDEIKREIILNISAISKFSKAVRGKIKSIEASLNINVNENTSASLGSLGLIASSLFAILENKDFKNLIVVLDDLERANIKIDLVLGFISQLKEEKNCKVILIMNEDEISNESYNKYKEKVIDYELLFNPSAEENFNVVKNLCVCFEDTLKEFFINNNISNIRTMHQVIHVINRLCKIENINKELLKEAVIHLTPFIYLKKVKNLSTKKVKEHLEEFKLFHFHRSSGEEYENKIDKNTEEIAKLFPVYYESFFVSFYPEFINPFLDYIDTEMLNPTLTSKIIKSIQKEEERRKHIQIRNFLNYEYEKYINTVSYTDNEFREKMWNFIEKNKDKIHLALPLSEIEYWLIKVLGKIDRRRKNEYKKIFINAFNMYLDEVFSESEEEFLRFTEWERIGDYHVKHYFDQYPEIRMHYEEKIKIIMQKYFENCNELKDLLIRAIKHGGWYGMEKILNHIPLKNLRKCIESSDNFISILLSFINIERDYNKFKEFVAKFDSLIEEFSKNNEIKEKVEFWKIRSGLKRR